VKLSWLLPLTVISILGFCESSWAARLTYWKFNKPLGRVELITDEGVKPEAHFLSNPSRVIIDLPETRLIKAKRKKTARGTKYVREVRVGQFDRTTTRMVIELGSQYTLNPDNVAIRSFSPTRWFVQLPKVIPLDKIANQGTEPIAIDVPGAESSPSLPTSPSIPSGRPRPSDWPRPESLSSPSIPSAPFPSATPLPPVKAGGVVVAIDPGHGGADVGAVGIGGMQEKIVVFSVAHQVAEQLRQKGVRAVLTRPGDQEIDLAPRVATARRIGADLFVSIHANSISLSRPDINGLETYYYGSSEGYRLARTIHNRLLSGTSLQDRGVRQARFYVIRRTSMPATLVEIGFVTGAQDAARFGSAAQRTKIAEAITQGILDYIQRR
jgi:N-acetylmuramoyl-L-alanine amidase